MLICTGGSKFAERIVDLTANLLDNKDDITIFHVKEQGVSEKTLERCNETLKKHGISAKTKLCENRLGVAKEISKESKNRYDLIIMGSLGMSSHGHGAFHRFLLGMNAFRVIEDSKTSVLIARGTSPLERILVGISGSKHDYKIAEFVCSLVGGHATKVKFLHVIPEISRHFKAFINPPQLRESMRDLLEEQELERPEYRYLDKCVDIANRCDIPKIKTKLREGDGATQILHEAEEGGYSLIVIGAQKSNKFPLGDTAHRIVNHSRNSLLVVRG